MSTFQSLPGFREFYPEDCAARNALFEKWRGAARRAGFQEYDGPILEPLELYTEKSGEEIRSQLFEFTDKGGRAVALRPEMTPTLARLVGARAGSLRRPVKWFSIGEQFRYEKPQKGRLRSFYQFNADILGEPGVGADAECIALLVETLRSCGLKDDEFKIYLSDRKLWFLRLEALFKSLNVTYSVEAASKVLSIIDKWDNNRIDLIKEQLVKIFGDRTEDAYADFVVLSKITSGPELLRYFQTGLEKEIFPALIARAQEWQELMLALNAMGLEKNYVIKLGIVRGLVYYTGFVFEAYQTVGTGRALAGGGRYDDLLQKLGGADLPAVGFAVGDVTVSDLLAELKRPLAGAGKLDVYVVIGEGTELRAAALKLVGQLRGAGVSVDYPLKDTGFGKQFKAADQCGARLAIILGPDEVKAGQVKIKDMQSGGEATVGNDDGLTGRVREILVTGLPAKPDK